MYINYLRTPYPTSIRDVTTRSRNPQISLVGSRPERILQNLRAVTPNSTLNNDAHLLPHFAQIRLLDSLWKSDRHVLRERVLDSHVEDKPLEKFIDDKEAMPKNGTSEESGYGGPTYEVHISFQKAVKENEKTG